MATAVDLGAAQEPRPYHHGDLRTSLATAARGLLETEGLDAVTLRAVAHMVGVSRQAPYHHFADKGALLAAVAADGFSALAAAMTARMDLEATANGRLMASGLAYVAFAVSNPALFRLMFGGSGLSFSTDEELLRRREACHRVMTDALREVGVFEPAEIEVASLAAWSTVHGLAELINKGAVPAPPVGDPAAEPFVRAVLSLLRF